jgi:hypothetical protein
MPCRSSPVTTLVKVAFAVCLVAVALVVVAARPAPALAATPCWRSLLVDWYDGRIDNTYAIHCYRDALKHLPTDVQTYSSAHDDIERALQAAITQEHRQGKKTGQNTLVPPEKGGGSGGSGTTKDGTTRTTTTTAGTPGRKTDGGLADKLNPSSPSSLPVPLLVLGGLALLLVAAGAAGLIAKRLQARRPNG